MGLFGKDINTTIVEHLETDISTPPRGVRKRTIQSENGIVTAAKKKRVNRTSDAKMITLSQRQTRIRDTAEQKITEACVELEATIMAANAPNIKPEIPSKFLAKVTELANGFKQVIQAVGGLKEEHVGAKKFSEWLQDAKSSFKACTSINDKLHKYVEDAQLWRDSMFDDE